MAFFEFGVFVNCWFLAFLAEFGDKAFLLTCAFTVWCPWNGIRPAQHLKLECLLIWAGTTLALTMRTILLASGVNPFQWDGISNVLAAIILVLCAIHATWQCRCEYLDFVGEYGGDVSQKLPITGDSEAGRIEELGADAEPAQATVKQEVVTLTERKPKGYGAVAYHAPMQTPEDRYGWARVLFFTMLIPGITVLFATAMDPSEGVLKNVDYKRLDVVLGAPVGYAFAEALAVFIGFSIAHWLRDGNDWRLLLAISVDYWLIAFCCTRDALVRLCEGNVPVAASFLSLFR